MDPLHQGWRTYRGYYGPDGQRAQLEDLLRDPDPKRLIVVSNFIFSSTETLVSTLMQVVPQWYVVTAAGETDDHAQAVTDYRRPSTRTSVSAPSRSSAAATQGS